MQVQNPRSKRHLFRKLFAPPFLIPGENAADYSSLQKEVFADLGVQNAVEAIFAKDVVDCEWGIRRFRRVEAALLTPRRPNSAQVTLAVSLQATVLRKAPAPPTPADERAEQLERIGKRFVEHNSEIEQVSLIERL